MNLLAKAQKYMGVFRGAVGAVKITNLTQIWELTQQAIAAVEEIYVQIKDMPPAEKKVTAKNLILKNIDGPFYKKWILSFVLGYVIDAVVAWKNKVYGKLWLTGDPSTGYEPTEDPIPVPETKIATIQSTGVVLDGVTVQSVLDAIKRHNESKPNLYINLFCLVQFILETGAFKHFRGFNLGGIKATEGWIRTGGKVWNAQTKEAEGGKLVNTSASFRAYDNVEHFLDDYAGIIYRVYPLAAQNNDCMWLYLAGLCKNKYGSGYATDPNYFSKLCSVAVQYAPLILGDGWKEHLIRMFELTRQRGFPLPGMEKAALKALG